MRSIGRRSFAIAVIVAMARCTGLLAHCRSRWQHRCSGGGALLPDCGRDRRQVSRDRADASAWRVLIRHACSWPGLPVLLGVLAAGCGSARLASQPAAPLTPVWAARSAQTTYPDLYVCDAGRFERRPSVIYLACGDGNLSAVDLVWSSWSATLAHATGQAKVNDCTPDCASGHFQYYPVRVKLSVVRHAHRRMVFTDAALTFTGPLPPGWSVGRSSDYVLETGP